MEKQRKAGILLAISSLPSEYGIGTFGKSAYEFVNFLKKANQSYWQILPLGHTSYGDSPYQTFSSFAGNPYYIDYDLLKDDGLLKYEDYALFKDSSTNIDYGMLYKTKYTVLKKAYLNFKKNKEFKEFVKDNKEWLIDYALFMSIKEINNGDSWLTWDDVYKRRNIKYLTSFKKENKDLIEFYEFIQYIFFKQWFKLKNYANSLGIKIIGDIPIYVAMDSSDVWQNPTYFELDENLNPTFVAGCPPDDFSPDGQLWGNPVYNYKVLKENNYDWWVKRIENSKKLYDVIRIDHFRGFEAFYKIPYGSPNAKHGKWVKGPNTSLFKNIKEKLGFIDIIAEDLGFLTEGVYKMINKLGYPGMKIVQFGFNLWEDSEHALHNVSNNCVVYTSSHDLPPIKAWYNKLPYQDKRCVLEYLRINNEEDVVDTIIKASLATNAKLVIIPLQDYLHLGEESRMNTPSTFGNNWKWRLSQNQLIDDLAYRIGYWTKMYKR